MQINQYPSISIQNDPKLPFWKNGGIDFIFQIHILMLTDAGWSRKGNNNLTKRKEKIC